MSDEEGLAAAAAQGRSGGRSDLDLYNLDLYRGIQRQFRSIVDGPRRAGGGRPERRACCVSGRRENAKGLARLVCVHVCAGYVRVRKWSAVEKTVARWRKLRWYIPHRNTEFVRVSA